MGRVICIIFLLQYAIATHAQQYLLKHITTANGMISNTVYGVIRDRQGFLWFTTDQGVCQYDGHEFKKITAKNGLPDNTVFSIKEDDQNRFWLKCYDNRPCYIQYGKVYTPDNDTLCRLIEQKSINDAYNSSSFSRNTFLADHFIPGITKYAAVKRSYYYNNEEVHYMFRCRNRDYFLSHNKLMTIINDSVISLKCPKISEALFQNNLLYGSFIVGNNNGVVYTISLDGDSTRVLQKIYTKYRVFSLASFQDTAVLLGTSAGVKSYPELNDFALENVPVSAIEQDIEGNYWFTTLTDGIYMLAHTFPHLLEKNKNSGVGKIQTLAPLSNGSLLIGYDNGSFDILNNKKVTRLTLPGNTYINTIRKICSINDDHIFICGDFGLYNCNLKTGHLQCLAPMAAAKSIYLGKDACLIGASSGAYSFDLHSHMLKTLWIKRTTAIYKDKDSTIWLGTLNGIFLYKNNKITKLDKDTALSKGRIIAIEQLYDDAVVIATHQYGIFIKYRNHIININENNGLSDNLCNHLFIDSLYNIWVCTGTGIDKITFDTARSTYSVYHVTSIGDISANSINDFFVKGDKIFIATPDAVVVTSSNCNTALPIKTYITSLTINGKSYFNTDSLLLNYNENNIQINFTGLAYSNGKSISYKYVLSGSKADTLYTTTNSINFTGLKPGKYSFIVWAKTNNSAWSIIPARVYLNIHYPFWETLWFYLLCALTITAIIIYLFRRRVKAIRYAETERTNIFKKTAELELQALRAQINPHFIFNVLNSIQHYYNNNDERNANRYISTFAKLIRKILNNSREHWTPLSEEINMITMYLELEKMRCNNKFDYKITMTGPVENVLIPAMLIQPYVENAIHHGLKPINRQGNLLLDFNVSDNVLYCSIDDDGIGINNTINKVKGQHKSLGMKITQERIEIINTIYSTDISVTVIDKSIKGIQKEGTLVKIVIPIKTENDG